MADEQLKPDELAKKNEADFMQWVRDTNFSFSEFGGNINLSKYEVRKLFLDRRRLISALEGAIAAWNELYGKTTYDQFPFAEDLEFGPMLKARTALEMCK
jgi:hypothetical protein